jgi:hypothetical protein
MARNSAQVPRPFPSLRWGAERGARQTTALFAREIELHRKGRTATKLTRRGSALPLPISRTWCFPLVPTYRRSVQVRITDCEVRLTGKDLNDQDRRPSWVNSTHQEYGERRLTKDFRRLAAHDCARKATPCEPIIIKSAGQSRACAMIRPATRSP